MREYNYNGKIYTEEELRQMALDLEMDFDEFISNEGITLSTSQIVGDLPGVVPGMSIIHPATKLFLNASDSYFKQEERVVSFLNNSYKDSDIRFEEAEIGRDTVEVLIGNQKSGEGKKFNLAFSQEENEKIYGEIKSYIDSQKGQGEFSEKPSYKVGDIKDFDNKSYDDGGFLGIGGKANDKAGIVRELREKFPKETGFSFSTGGSGEILIIEAPNGEILTGDKLSEYSIREFINANSKTKKEINVIKNNEERTQQRIENNTLDIAVNVINSKTGPGTMVTNEETNPMSTIATTYVKYEADIRSEVFKQLNINPKSTGLSLSKLDKIWKDAWANMQLSEKNATTFLWAGELSKHLESEGENKTTILLNGLEKNFIEKQIKAGSKEEELRKAGQEYVRLGYELDNYTGDKSSDDYKNKRTKFENVEKNYKKLFNSYTSKNGNGSMMFDRFGNKVDVSDWSPRKISEQEEKGNITDANVEREALKQTYIRNLINFRGEATNNQDALQPYIDLFLLRENHFQQTTKRNSWKIKFDLSNDNWVKRNIKGGWIAEAGEGHSVLADLGGHNFTGWENLFRTLNLRDGSIIQPTQVLWKDNKGKEFSLNELVDVHTGISKQKRAVKIKGQMGGHVTMSTIFLTPKDPNSATWKYLVKKGVFQELEDHENKDKNTYVLGFVDGFEIPEISIHRMHMLNLDGGELHHMDAKTIPLFGDDEYLESITGIEDQRFTKDMMFADGKKLGTGKWSMYLDDKEWKGQASPAFSFLMRQLNGTRVENRDLAIESGVITEMMYLNIDAGTLKGGSEKSDLFDKGATQTTSRPMANIINVIPGVDVGAGTEQTLEAQADQFSHDIPDQLNMASEVYQDIDNTIQTLFQDDPETEGHDFPLHQFPLTGTMKENMEMNFWEKFSYTGGSLTPMVAEFAILNGYVNGAMRIGWGAKTVKAFGGTYKIPAFTSFSHRLSNMSTKMYKAVNVGKGYRHSKNAISHAQVLKYAKAAGMSPKKWLKTSKLGKNLKLIQGKKLQRAGALFINAGIEEGKMQLMNPLFGIDMGHGTGFGFYLGGSAMRWLTPFRFTAQGMGITAGRWAGRETAWTGLGSVTAWGEGIAPTFNYLFEKGVLAGLGGAAGSQVASIVSAGIEDMRGRKAFTTFLDEHYHDWDEWGDDVLLEVIQFGALGLTHVKAVDGKFTLTSKRKAIAKWRKLANDQIVYKEGKQRKVKDVNGKKPHEKGYQDTWSEKPIDKEKTNWSEVHKYEELANMAEAQVNVITNAQRYLNIDVLHKTEDRRYKRFIQQVRKKENLSEDPFEIVWTKNGKWDNNGVVENLKGDPAKVILGEGTTPTKVIVDLRKAKPGTMPHEIYHVLMYRYFLKKGNKGKSQEYLEKMNESLHESLRETIMSKLGGKPTYDANGKFIGLQKGLGPDAKGNKPIYFPVKTKDGKPHPKAGEYDAKSSKEAGYVKTERELTKLEIAVEQAYKKSQDRKDFNEEYNANLLELMMTEVGHNIFIEQGFMGALKRDLNSLRTNLFAGTNFMGINFDALAPKLDLSSPQKVIEHMYMMGQNWGNAGYSKKQKDRFMEMFKDMEISGDGSFITQKQDVGPIITKGGGKSSKGTVTDIIINTKPEIIKEQKEIAKALRQNLEDVNNKIITTEQYQDLNAPLTRRWTEIQSLIRAKKPIKTKEEILQERSDKVQAIYENTKLSKNDRSEAILKEMDTFINMIASPRSNSNKLGKWRSKEYDKLNPEQTYEQADFKQDLQLTVHEMIFPVAGKKVEFKAAYNPSAGTPLTQYIMQNLPKRVEGIFREAKVGEFSKEKTTAEWSKIENLPDSFKSSGESNLNVTTETTNTGKRLSDVLIKQTVKDGKVSTRSWVENSVVNEIINNFKGLNNQPKQNASTLSNLAPIKGKDFLGKTELHKKGPKTGKVDFKKTVENKIEGLIEIGPSKAYIHGIRKSVMLKTGVPEIEGISTLIDPLILGKFFKTGERLSFKETGKAAGPKEQIKIDLPQNKNKIEVELRDGRKIELKDSDIWVLNKLGVDIIDGKINISRMKTQVRKPGDVNIKTLNAFEGELLKVLSNQTVREHVIEFGDKKNTILDDISKKQSLLKSLQNKTDLKSTREKENIETELKKSQKELDKLYEEYGLSEEFVSKDVVNTFLNSVKSSMPKEMFSKRMTMEYLNEMTNYFEDIVGPISIGHLRDILVKIPNINKDHAVIQELQRRISKNSEVLKENIDFQIKEMLRAQPEVEMKVLEAKNWADLSSQIFKPSNLKKLNLDATTKELIKKYDGKEFADGEKSIYKSEDAIKSREKLQEKLLIKFLEKGIDIGISKNNRYEGIAADIKKTFGFGSRSYKIWIPEIKGIYKGKQVDGIWINSTSADARVNTDKVIKSTQKGDASKTLIKVGKEKLSVKFVLDNYKITDTGKFKTWQAEFIENYKGKNLETDLYHASRAELSKDGTSKGYENTLKANEGLRKIYLNTLRDVIVEAKSSNVKKGELNKAETIVEVMRHLRSQTNIGLGIVKGTATITSVSNRLGLEKFEGNKGSMFHAEHQLQLLNHTYMFMDMALKSKSKSEFDKSLDILSREFEQASTRYEDVKIYDSPLYGGKTGFIEYFKNRNLGELSSIANIMYRPGITFEMVDLKSKIPGETIGSRLIKTYNKNDILDIIDFFKSKTPESYTGEIAKLKVDAKNKETNIEVKNNLNKILDNQLGGKYSKGISSKETLENLGIIDLANNLGRKINKKARGMSTWDFDDTLAYTKSGVRYTLPNPSGKPAPQKKVIFMAGGAGSGKSNVIKQLGLEKQGFKIVNQDISLEWLMKNHGLPSSMKDFTPQQRKTFGKLTWEARQIALKKQMKFQGKGDGVIVDGTGANIKSIEKLVKEFTDKGYDAQMLFVETSLDISIARNKARPERSLKTSIVKNTWEKVMSNKKSFKKIFGDRFAEVNTDKLKQGDNMPLDLIKKIDAFTKGYIKARLNAGEFADKGKKLKDQGAEFDFSEFNIVKEGTKGPFWSKFAQRIKKFGPEHQYILTARPPESQVPIYEFLKSQGIEIPLQNIKGLGNSTGEAKAMWMLRKFSEGYNDMYFADDALANVRAVKDVLNQLDIKSKVQQAGPQSKSSKNIEANLEKMLNEYDPFVDLGKTLNKAIEHKKNVNAHKTYSAAKARILGNRLKHLKLWGTPGSEDFMGLVTYAFSGKGKKGEAHKKFFEEVLHKPYNRAYNDIHNRKQSISNDYKELRKQFPEVRKVLNKKLKEDRFYTTDHAIRAYLMNKAGYEIPGLSKRDLKTLDKFVKSNADIMAFADKLFSITKLKEGWIKPGENWLGSNITMDLNNVVDKVYRKEALSEFMQNREAMFGKWKNGKLIGKNMNKIEALYGVRHREALENIIWRMENMTNRNVGVDSNVNKWMNWVNNATGTIMFFNQKSAALQLISTANYVNGTFNNPIRAARAFANQPQYWKDFAKIFNSDMMVQRRAGLKINIEAAELVERVGGSKDKASAALKYLLEKGFIPTKYADSFAISIGGATYYRNSIRKYKKQGLSEKQAEKKAWEDFTDMTEYTQQSSRPDLISMQQASVLGRPILAFANTPMQMFRRHKRRIQDIANNRGNMAENISSALYYGFVQSVIFSYLTNAMFAVDDESKDEADMKHAERHKDRFINTIADSYLRGMGTGGSSVAAIKNSIFTFFKESEKGYNADYGNVVVDLLNVSPPIGSKARKIYQSSKIYKHDKDVMGEMGWDLDNPANLAVANVLSAAFNIPADRIVKKVNNIRDASTGDFETWQRISMLMGFNKWTLNAGGGIAEEKVEKVKTKVKEEKKLEKKKQKYGVETEKEVIRIDKGKEIKKLNKNQQQFIIYNILGNEDQIPVYDYKNEDSRVNKILEHWDENKNYIDSLLNTDIDKERTLNDYYMEQVHGR